MHHIAPALADRLLRIEEVCEIVQRSRASIYRDIKAGAFPAQVKIGAGVRWRLSEISRFLADLGSKAA